MSKKIFVQNEKVTITKLLGLNTSNVLEILCTLPLDYIKTKSKWFSHVISRSIIIFGRKESVLTQAMALHFSVKVTGSHHKLFVTCIKLLLRKDPV